MFAISAALGAALFVHSMSQGNRTNDAAWIFPAILGFVMAAGSILFGVFAGIPQ